MFDKTRKAFYNKNLNNINVLPLTSIPKQVQLLKQNTFNFPQFVARLLKQFPGRFFHDVCYFEVNIENFPLMLILKIFKFYTDLIFFH